MACACGVAYASGQPVTPSGESKPHVRELQTGYLLNCSFLSPKPYCWTHPEHPLSGWKTDLRGGRLEFQPTCKYPEGFGFHSDWFKLVDTNTSAYVALSHQIARQTNGCLTLEFRFRLPSPMDGARWQLCDLAKTGVSLVTADGKLCVETRGGKRVPLVRIEKEHEYGIKVVADLTSKNSSVFVDGELKAKGVAFTGPIESVDFFHVETSKLGTGDLFLNPVRISKGYPVNETFVACAEGTLPEDWRGSRAAVRVFECGTKPDIFSLKLEAPPQRSASARKAFSPIGGKSVVEYRLLLPEKRDGAMAALHGGRSGIQVTTKGGDLCLKNASSGLVPLVRNYRSNLWYTVKIVADPIAKEADIFVNGKVAAERIRLDAGVRSFSEVRFSAGPGTVLWIDDVQVYPWHDYPVDYVPEPKPVSARNNILLGVQSCNLWREGTAYAGWDYVLPYRTNREPFLGWYDEGHPEETDWEIKWQVEHGIGFEQHCWYRPNNAINLPVKDGVLDHGIIQGLFNARYSHLRKFTIMFTNEGAGETNPTDWRENIIPYWIEYFFKDPRYLKVDGKPVLSIYHLGNFERMFGGIEGARQAIRTLRDQAAAAGFPGIIILMEERNAQSEGLAKMKALGVDYCYAYTWLTPDAAKQRRMNLAQRDAAALAGIGMLPSLSMGWDREAWGVRDGGWLPVPEYESLAAWARDEFLPSLPPDSLGRRMVMLANWNEFGEGHFLMPSTLAGFGYLDALRKVFTGGGAHDDARPTEQQRRRFTILYPEE